MKKAALLSSLTLVVLATRAWSLSDAKAPSVHLPWKEAGLTEKQAAAHLLNRFAFGPRPGEVDAVVKMGLDRWFERQLAGGLPDERVQEDLRALPALQMSTQRLLETYPPIGVVLFQAREAGVIPDGADPKDLKEGNKAGMREKVRAFAMRPSAGADRPAFCELAGKHLGIADDGKLFPGWTGKRIPLLKA